MKNWLRPLLTSGSAGKRKSTAGLHYQSWTRISIPVATDDHEPWMDSEEKVKYVPLQAKEGDLAIFLLSGAHEVIYEGDKYFIVSQAAILMLEREQDL